MYDLAIIGAGAAGIAAAKHSIKQGLNTVLIEKNIENFGGVCLNKGCIPTKLFLNIAKQKKDWFLLNSLKNNIIEEIKKSTISYLNKSGIKILFEEVTFLDEHRLKATNQIIQAKNIIIATGSLPKKILKSSEYIFSEELLDKSYIGDKILIVGAGYVGLEFASLLHALNKEVTIIEKEEEILPNLNTHLKKRLRLILEKKGIKIYTSTDVLKFSIDGFDTVIFCVGRIPNTSGLGLESVGVTLENGWIKTDKYLQTTVDNIFACGDVINKKFFAYIAEYQARICINNIISKKVEEDYSGIAECIFSIPQLATVGFTERDADFYNIKYKVIKSNFLKFSSAYIYEDFDGFIEVILNEDDKIIGAQIISNYAAELINIFSLAIKNNLTLNDLKKCSFIHPTISEIISLFISS